MVRIWVAFCAPQLIETDGYLFHCKIVLHLEIILSGTKSGTIYVIN